MEFITRSRCHRHSYSDGPSPGNVSHFYHEAGVATRPNCVDTCECFSNYDYVLCFLCIHRTRTASSKSGRAISYCHFGERGFGPTSDPAPAGDGQTFGRELDSTSAGYDRTDRNHHRCSYRPFWSSDPSVFILMSKAPFVRYLELRRTRSTRTSENSVKAKLRRT
jgi:hypothetical protein